MTATTFPAPVFAALTPAPFLHAHLTQTPPTRPSNRSPQQPRAPKLNVSSLTHASGSAVVRLGDTAIVAGIRAEILDAQDAPNPPSSSLLSNGEDGSKQRRAADMMQSLIVPNVEFATGCSADQVPGSAPSAVAQASAWLVKDLLVSLQVVRAEQLEIWGRPRASSESSHEESDEDENMHDDDTAEEEAEIVGYFVLYIDLVVVSLAGSPGPALWAAALAALRSTRLPKAGWSSQLETIVCSPLLEDASVLETNGLPIACSYAVFSPSLHKGLKDQKEDYVLADPDTFEESVCREEVLVVVDCSDLERGTRFLRLQKRGGFVVDEVLMKQIVELSTQRWAEWRSVLEDS